MSARRASQSQNKKSSGCLKAALFGCGGCSVLILLLGVLVGAGISYVWMTRVQTVPARVEASAREVLQYEFPGGSHGTFSLDLGFTLAHVMGTNTPSTRQLMVFTAPGGWAQSGERLMYQFTRILYRQQNLSIEKTKRMTGNICQQKVPLQQSSGWMQQSQSRVPMALYQSCFKRNGRWICFLIIGSDSDAQGKARAILGSLSCPR